MSDAYAAPGPWAAGRANRGPGPADPADPTRRGKSRRRGRRYGWDGPAASAGREEGREAFRTAMAADDDADERGRRGRRGAGRPGPRGRGFGGPGFGGPGFGGPGGPPRGRGRGRARRGDVRAAILVLLAEEPRNGYGVIQEIEERSDGVWKPSPGAVYPALQQLEDEGLVEPVEVEGRKLFALTDTGRTQVEALSEADAPWAAVAQAAGTGYRDAKHQLAQLWHAYAAVHHDGTPEQVAAAAKIVSDARRSLYRILAEDDDVTVEPPA